MGLAGFQRNQIADVPDGSGYTDRDLSVAPFNVPVGAVGVVIEVTNSGGSRTFSARKNGSTDARNTAPDADINSNGHQWLIVGIDASGIVELSQENADVSWFLRGYFDGHDETFDTNATIFTPTAGSFNDVDISTQTGGETAICAFVEMTITSRAAQNVRKNGSTDNRLTDLDNHNYFGVGVDGSEIFEALRQTDGVLAVLGWMTAGSQWNTNAIDRTGTLPSDNTFGDLDALSVGAEGGHLEVSAGAQIAFHARRKGDTDDATAGSDDISEDISHWAGRADSSRIVEARRADATPSFFEMGIYLPRSIAVDAGVYTFTGQDVGTAQGFVIVPDAGVFLFVGQDVTFRLSMPVDAGVYSFVGQAVTTRRGSLLVSDAGVFVYTGQAVTFRFSMPVDAGAYSFTGQAVGTVKGVELTADAGVYAYTGQAVTFRFAMPVDAGVYAYTGQAVTFRFSMPVGAGAFVLTGQDVTTFPAFGVPADAGAYSLVGQNIVTVRKVSIVSAAGVYVYIGQGVETVVSSVTPIDIELTVTVDNVFLDTEVSPDTTE